MDSDDSHMNGSRYYDFPVYLLLDDRGTGPLCHPQEDGTVFIVLLTDEDSLNCFRHDHGIPERGALKFQTAQQLLAVLQQAPPHVVGICFDVMRTNRKAPTQPVQALLLQEVRDQLAAGFWAG